MDNNEIKTQLQNLKAVAIANVAKEIEGVFESIKLQIGKGQYVYNISPADGNGFMPVVETNGVACEFGLLGIDEILELDAQIKQAKYKNILGGKGKPCYTVVHEVCCDGDEHTLKILGTFTDRDRARAVMKVTRDQYATLIDKKELWINPEEEEDRDDFDDNPDCFHIWKSGYYSTDHVYLAVVENEYHKTKW